MARLAVTIALTILLLQLTPLPTLAQPEQPADDKGDGQCHDEHKKTDVVELNQPCRAIGFEPLASGDLGTCLGNEDSDCSRARDAGENNADQNKT